MKPTVILGMARVETLECAGYIAYIIDLNPPQTLRGKLNPMSYRFRQIHHSLTDKQRQSRF